MYIDLTVALHELPKRRNDLLNEYFTEFQKKTPRYFKRIFNRKGTRIWQNIVCRLSEILLSLCQHKNNVEYETHTISRK